MGSVLFEFLNESPLLDDAMIAEQYSSLSEKALRSELDRYREYCLAHINTLFGEVAPESKLLRLFAGASFRRMNSLKQAAFYLDAVILPDPLFPFSYSGSHVGTTMARYLEMPATDTIGRAELAQAAHFLLQVRPMVAANYVRFLPISYFSEPPAQLPIRYSPTQFAELLPPSILERYWDAAKVTSMKKSTAGWVLQDTLSLGRGIGIRFEGDDPASLYVYNLFAQKVLSVDEETRLVRMQWSLPDDPPSPDYFATWVTQSVNSSAHTHFEELNRELALATQCNAMYLTNSAFTANLLDSSTSANATVQTDTANLVLKLELQFFQDVSMEDLMYVRTSDGEAFDLFRRELEKQFRELRTETDPDRLKVKLENAMHEISEVQLTKVTQAISRMRKTLATDVVIAAAGLVGTVATSGLSLLATAVATLKGYKTLADYQKAVRENPAYFLWKVKSN